MENLNRRIGRNIRRLRQNAGMTQQDLAERLSRMGQDRSLVSLSHYESGRTTVNSKLLIGLASIFNCSLESITGPVHQEATQAKAKKAKVLRNMADLLKK